jgi:HTH-type transcriptional regulator, competence development regulator
MRFGEKVRALRTANNLSLRALAERVSVSFAYISKVENGKLDFGEFPSEGFIRKLASALEADEEELLLLAEKIPEAIRRRFFERPDAFRLIARLDDRRLDRVLAFIEGD